VNNKYPALFHFLAGYFHGDWKCDHDTEDDVVRLFIIESTSGNLAQVKDELKALLNETQTEEKLREFLFDEIGCAYYYSYAWPSGKAWLEHVINLLQTETQ
jgi:hypothetical protein